MADAAHQDGNAFYKSGELEKAEKSYALAYKLDPTEPKYASNLSAVYYEQGQYLLCLDAITNSWRALRVKYSVDGQPKTPPPTDSLAKRLSVRFLKAKLNAILSGLVSLHDDKKPKKKKSRTNQGNSDIQQDIQSFCEVAVKEPDSSLQQQELHQTWGLWLTIKAECERHTSEECKAKIAEAEKRLRDLPIYRKSLIDVLQYFRFGHDDVRSIFFGVAGNSDDKDAINEETILERKDWKTLSVLFGGSGDGRHVFATMIHYLDMWKLITEHKWPGRGFGMPALHMTLFDIHPALIARVMLIFALLRKAMTSVNTIARLEFEATAFYVWCGLHLPEYCAKTIMDVSTEIMHELQGTAPIKLSKLWAVDQNTKTSVLKIFAYWSKPLPKDMEIWFDVNGPAKIDALSDPFLQMRLTDRDEEFEALVDARKTMGCWFPAEKDKDLPVYNDWDKEDALFQFVRILLPPKELLGRHPALEKYVRSGGRLGKQGLRKEVIKEWKPNATLFDNDTSESIAYNSILTPGYTKISFDEDFSQTTNNILGFLAEFRGGKELSPDQTAFSVIRQMFDSIMQCFALLDPHDGMLTLEFVCADLYAGLPKLVVGDLGPRPASFPKKYLRMWLSNTPDYTGGILSNIIYLVPYLDDGSHAMMMWNCLLNTASWSSLKHMALNYTYLNAQGIHRFFSCLLPDEDQSPYNEFCMSVVPRTTLFSSIVSKKELFSYLSWILMRVLCCPRSGRVPSHIDEPTNMVNFFRILVALCQHFGCPAHWIGDYVQLLINDSLMTTATLFDGILPITQMPAPKPTQRKINLEPYQLEIETILVSVKGGIPFPITYPERYASSLDSIKTYTTSVKPSVPLPGDIDPSFATASLLFYKAGSSHHVSTIRNLPARIPALIESKDGSIDGIQVQIVSAVDVVNFEKKVVTWRMSENWAEKMKREEWSMVVWITNRRMTVSEPKVALAWKEVTV